MNCEQAAWGFNRGTGAVEEGEDDLTRLVDATRPFLSIEPTWTTKPPDMSDERF